jgi:hypothetical protein
MFSSLIVVVLALASQVGGADARYLGGTSGQPSATSASPGGAPATLAPLTNPASPATTGAPRSTPSAPSSNPYAPTRPSNFNSPPTTPAFNSNAAPRSAGQVQPPPGYPSQNNGFPSNDSASAPQPPSRSAVMMQAMLTPPRNSQLPGDSVRLVDVVSTGRTRNEQTQRIEAYWDLCSSVADYYLSVREQDELRNLSAAASRQSASLQEADKKMAVRSDTSLRAARASQFRLAGFIGRGPNNLPLPGDLPHCGTYTNRYDQVFAGRSSPEAQGLAQLLPMRYAELDEAAAGVLSAEDWMKEVVSRTQQNSDADGPLKALELLALERRAFVQIARDYNRRIARYSELATPGQISPDRLTGMLIKRPGSSTATRSAAPAPPPTRTSSGVETAPQRTFANSANTADWLPPEKPSMTGAAKVDPAVQPASATQSSNNKEHSLVIPRQ